jgi:hypothetical protein
MSSDVVVTSSPAPASAALPLRLVVVADAGAGAGDDDAMTIGKRYAFKSSVCRLITIIVVEY